MKFEYIKNYIKIGSFVGFALLAGCGDKGKGGKDMLKDEDQGIQLSDLTLSVKDANGVIGGNQKDKSQIDTLLATNPPEITVMGNASDEVTIEYALKGTKKYVYTKDGSVEVKDEKGKKKVEKVKKGDPVKGKEDEKNVDISHEELTKAGYKFSARGFVAIGTTKKATLDINGYECKLTSGTGGPKDDHKITFEILDSDSKSVQSKVLTFKYLAGS